VSLHGGSGGRWALIAWLAVGGKHPICLDQEVRLQAQYAEAITLLVKLA
jgi:hypothetical protein